ncbi:MAG: OmpA family protein [Rhizomicrobium sp.]|jgi:outer membrane protein OmpA-like peptidoglycan-associated protein
MRRGFLPVVTVIAALAGLNGAAVAQSAGPLLQPGEPYPGAQSAPVHLHLPTHHGEPATKDDSAGVASSAPSSTQSALAPRVDLIHPPHRKAKPKLATTAPGESAASPPPSAAQENVPFSFTKPDTPAEPEVVRQTTAKPTGMPRNASLPTGEHAKLDKRGAILFDKGVPSPSPAQYHGVKVLADDLNAQLEKGASAIQLEAYGGAPGDKSSDARRLSLRRALAVRQLLIDDGVPSARIDVRAMGGSDDSGPADRVDVFVRSS